MSDISLCGSCNCMTKTICKEPGTVPHCGKCGSAKAEAKEGWQEELTNIVRAEVPLDIPINCVTNQNVLIERVSALFRSQISNAKLEGARGCRDAVNEKFRSVTIDGDYTGRNLQGLYSIALAADSHVGGMGKDNPLDPK